jgi:hypothetical protein
MVGLTTLRFIPLHPTNCAAVGLKKCRLIPGLEAAAGLLAVAEQLTCDNFARIV